MIWMFSTAMKAPSSAPSTIAQVVKLARSAGPRGLAVASNTAMMHAFAPRCQWATAGCTGLASGADLGIDGRGNGHARPQIAAQRIVRIDRDLHRDALHDLGEVAGGVVGRQQREFLAAGRRDAVDMAFDGRPRIGVDHDADRLALADAGKLGLLEIRDHIDRGERHHRHELGAGLHVFSDAQATIADDAVDRRHDIGIAEVQLRLLLHGLVMLQGRIGLGELRLQHADLLLGGRNRGRIARERGARGVAPRVACWAISTLPEPRLARAP